MYEHLPIMDTFLTKIDISLKHISNTDIILTSSSNKALVLLSNLYFVSYLAGQAI
jgi:hypothetical protein